MRWVLLIALVGCERSGNWVCECGYPNDSDTADTAIASGSPTGSPTGTPTAGFTPTTYTVSYAWFGVQGGVPTSLDDIDLFGTPIQTPIQLAVRLGDDTAPLGPTPDNHCDVVLTTYDPQPRPPWEGSANAWFAVELPADAAISDANCDTLDLAADWSDPASRVGAHHWGVAVTALDQADLDALGGTTASTLAPAWIGGRWWSDAEPGAVAGGVVQGPGVATGNQVDGNGVILRDGNHDLLALDAGDVPVAGGVVDGYYVVTPIASWRGIPPGF